MEKTTIEIDSKLLEITDSTNLESQIRVIEGLQVATNAPVFGAIIEKLNLMKLKECKHTYPDGSSSIVFAAGISVCHLCGWDDWYC